MSPLEGYGVEAPCYICGAISRAGLTNHSINGRCSDCGRVVCLAHTIGANDTPGKFDAISGTTHCPDCISRHHGGSHRNYHDEE
jgi:hypothetical protein